MGNKKEGRDREGGVGRKNQRKMMEEIIQCKLCAVNSRVHTRGAPPSKNTQGAPTPHQKYLCETMNSTATSADLHIANL